MRRRIIASTSITFIFVAAIIFVMPIVLNSPYSCPIASAQDNPCLAQDATISALQIERSQLKGMISDLQTQVAALHPNSVATAAPQTGFTPFREDFNNNDLGWAVGGTSDGAVEIRNGTLTLTASEDRTLVTFVPNIQVTGDFYIEMQLNNTSFPFGFEIGFWQGDYVRNTYHTFAGTYSMTGGGFSGDSGVFFFENVTQIAGAEGDRPGASSLIALERREGTYNFYIDDRLRLSYTGEPLGSQLGLYAARQRGDGIEIEYVVMREAK